MRSAPRVLPAREDGEGAPGHQAGPPSRPLLSGTPRPPPGQEDGGRGRAAPWLGRPVPRGHTELRCARPLCCARQPTGGRAWHLGTCPPGADGHLRVGLQRGGDRWHQTLGPTQCVPEGEAEGPGVLVFLGRPHLPPGRPGPSAVTCRSGRAAARCPPAQDSLPPWHSLPTAQGSPGAPEEGLQGGPWCRRPAEARAGVGSSGAPDEESWPLPVTGPVRAQNLPPTPRCSSWGTPGRWSGHEAGPHAAAPAPPPPCRAVAGSPAGVLGPRGVGDRPS